MYLNTSSCIDPGKYLSTYSTTDWKNANSFYYNLVTLNQLCNLFNYFLNRVNLRMLKLNKDYEWFGNNIQQASIVKTT